jgi:4-hydroxymandelate oxidase
MGGVNNNVNFKLNCIGWTRLFEQASTGEKEKILGLPIPLSVLRMGPVTGAEQNVGFAREADFYQPYFSAAYDAGIGLCAGDGYPDEKLQLGIEAVRTLQKKDPHAKAAFFIKPYQTEKMIERAGWTESAAGIIGTDIDAYHIVTMRNLARLEKKSPEQLSEFRKLFSVPFAVKGIFTREDIDLVKVLKPDIAYISNHGGRVDTRIGSTAEFFAASARELRDYCGEIWVDGGIRTGRDIRTALYYGAAQVVVVRPFISALCSGGTEEMIVKIHEILDI